MWLDVVALKQTTNSQDRNNRERTALFIVGLVIVALWLARVMLKEKQGHFVTDLRSVDLGVDCRRQVKLPSHDHMVAHLPHAQQIRFHLREAFQHGCQVIEAARHVRHLTTG